MKGYVSLKKRTLGGFQEKYVILVQPNSVKDVEVCFQEIFDIPAWTISNDDMMKCLGHITKAAVHGEYPVYS
jgi:hypothetical protein